MLDLLLAAAAALATAAASGTPPGTPAAPQVEAPDATPAGPPVQIEFTGKTDANEPLVGDVMQEVIRFTNHHLKCSQITKVNATILPKDWQPKDPNFRIGPPSTQYERWVVTMCGKEQPFLLGFWSEGKAGAQYSVGHPYPEEAAPVGKN